MSNRIRILPLSKVMKVIPNNDGGIAANIEVESEFPNTLKENEKAVADIFLCHYNKINHANLTSKSSEAPDVICHNNGEPEIAMELTEFVPRYLANNRNLAFIYQDEIRKKFKNNIQLSFCSKANLEFGKPLSKKSKNFFNRLIEVIDGVINSNLDSKYEVHGGINGPYMYVDCEYSNNQNLFVVYFRLDNIPLTHPIHGLSDSDYEELNNNIRKKDNKNYKLKYNKTNTKTLLLLHNHDSPIPDFKKIDINDTKFNEIWFIKTMPQRVLDHLKKLK